MLKTNRLIINEFTSDDFASAVGALKHPSMQTEIEAAGAYLRLTSPNATSIPDRCPNLSGQFEIR